MSVRSEVGRTGHRTQRRVWVMLALLVGGVVVVLALQLLPDGGASEGEATAIPPAVLERVEGTDLSRVRLSEAAAERLGVQTAAVSKATAGNAGAAKKVVPYAALVYDGNGETWVYTRPEPLVFVRAPVVVDRIEGEFVYLTDGPPAGTEVATVGVAELYGTEFEVDH